ncbi:hemerythrin domain-containing protein [Paracoccus marinaquae]|uniref:Hemerythrin domain-containing protein n=1 Tax=Paracoccus marinaquae TaxID=2841926 RepID=A0ABS6AJ33_9RHOB|nr:hemerythrin domain-containing protein [Paracoccus marinaquae]MBU3030605.1 hemerythrin domain-containing protein [Paracoccus marinaquae]
MTAAHPPQDPAGLTAFIETQYHAKHRQQLPELAALSNKVETVHAGQAHVPAGLSVLLQRMIGEMEVHMKKEELILFPAMRRASGGGLQAPIAAMRGDHDDHAAEIRQIRALTDDLTLPEGACRSWTRLYQDLQGFVADLEEHIRLENEVLFPQFEPDGAHHG